METSSPVAEIWKTLNRGPHAATSGFIFDGSGRILLLHRSETVRSAKNCWSLPSGLHENGLTLQEQFGAEITEELGLELAHPADEMLSVGFYENIARVDNWHWVIGVFLARVKTFDTLVNREPDKHDDIQLVATSTFDPTAWHWAPNLGGFITKHWSVVQTAISLNLGLGVPFSKMTPFLGASVPETNLTTAAAS